MTLESTFLSCKRGQHFYKIAFQISIFTRLRSKSCFFSTASFESSLSITYDSLTIHGTTFDEELEVSLNIHNNSDSDITVFASRNILSENAPTNWFCWDLCYFPTTDVSPFGVEIPAVSYTNEFSGHLVPSIYGGSYDIEYCFY